VDEEVLAPDELLEDEEPTCTAASIGEEPPPQADSSRAAATEIVAAPALGLYCRCVTYITNLGRLSDPVAEVAQNAPRHRAPAHTSAPDPPAAMHAAAASHQV
jgi:hypothetical protein